MSAGYLSGPTYGIHARAVIVDNGSKDRKLRSYEYEPYGKESQMLKGSLIQPIK